MNTVKKFNLDANSLVIASNGNRFLATNENISINDIYNYAVIIDETGTIISEPQLIGTIIKFGYWRPESFSLADLKNRVYIEKIITDALIGFAVGEDFSKSLLKSGMSNLKTDEKNLLIGILPISLFCIFGLVDNEYEAINNALSISTNNDITKMGIYIYISFLKKIVQTKDKFKSFEYIRNINYSNLYSLQAQQEYYTVLNENYKNIKQNEINQSKYIIDVLKSIFYCILKANDYEQTIITSTKFKNVDSTIVAITGLIAGVLYGEKNIPVDWIIDLKSEDYLRDLATDFSETILFEINDRKTILK